MRDEATTPLQPASWPTASSPAGSPGSPTTRRSPRSAWRTGRPSRLIRAVYLRVLSRPPTDDGDRPAGRLPGRHLRRPGRRRGPAERRGAGRSGGSRGRTTCTPRRPRSSSTRRRPPAPATRRPHRLTARVPRADGRRRLGPGQQPRVRVRAVSRWRSRSATLDRRRIGRRLADPTAATSCRARAAAGAPPPRASAGPRPLAGGRATPRGKAEACIFLWLGGGAAQIDTFDPKRRGDGKKKPGSYYDAIPTAIAGERVCEHLGAGGRPARPLRARPHRCTTRSSTSTPRRPTCSTPGGRQRDGRLSVASARSSPTSGAGGRRACRPTWSSATRTSAAGRASSARSTATST